MEEYCLRVIKLNMERSCGQSFWLHFREPIVTSKSHHRLPIVSSGKPSTPLILLFFLKQVWLIVFPCSSGRLGGCISPAQKELRCSSSREQGRCFANQPSARGALLPSCSQEEAHQRHLLAINPTTSGRTLEFFQNRMFLWPSSILPLELKCSWVNSNFSHKQGGTPGPPT